MKAIYGAILMLVLYGDLLKRALPPAVAQAALYTLALLIVALILNRGGLRARLRPSREGRLVYVSVSALLVLYLAQLWTAPIAAWNYAIAHWLYMSVPLTYIVALQKRCATFDLRIFARWFLVLMLPIDVVAMIQHSVDANFMISTAYAGEGGGLILRNLLDEGFFVRYPSIFASADRYSAMALFHLYFTLTLIPHYREERSHGKLWLLLNMATSIAGLLVAGARSRILIAAAGVALVAITATFRVVFSRRISMARKLSYGLVGLLVAGTAAALGGFASSQVQLFDSFPVLSFLNESIEHNDLTSRVSDALGLSLDPNSVSIFGEGLGSVGFGKPGEFGIMSMWIESGFFWGILMLGAFSTFTYALLSATVRSFAQTRPIAAGQNLMVFLLVVFGLLAGLTGTFELSSGILLGCIIAVNLRAPNYAPFATPFAARALPTST
jgi:hypothetical protein